VKDKSGSLVCLVLLTCCVVLPVSEADAQGWVEYQNGKLSMAFEQAPVELVVALIREETGMLVVLPPAARGKFLSERVNALPPEAAVQRILRALGLSNFVLLYDGAGRAERLIVLEPGSDAPGMLGAALPSADPGVSPVLMPEGAAMAAGAVRPLDTVKPRGPEGDSGPFAEHAALPRA
jgi:hypothetical protein